MSFVLLQQCPGMTGLDWHWCVCWLGSTCLLTHSVCWYNICVSIQMTGDVARQYRGSRRVGIQIPRPWVRSPGGAGWEPGFCPSLRVNSVLFVHALACAWPPFVLSARTLNCGHVKDPISICRKRVGFTAGGMKTQKHWEKKARKKKAG